MKHGKLDLVLRLLPSVIFGLICVPLNVDSKDYKSANGLQNPAKGSEIFKTIPDYPRIFPNTHSSVTKSRATRLQLEPKTCDNPKLEYSIVCLIFFDSPRMRLRAVQLASQYKLGIPKISGGNHNAWKLALLYDQLASRSVGLTASNRLIRNKLTKSLQQYLTLLDEGNASLWHGRLSLASYAFILAVSVGDTEPELLARAYSHFSDVVRALQITEAWPNGYSYWINNRAVPFLLAVVAYLNGTDGQRKAELRQLVKRLGLWQIYMTRPDHRIEAIGDEGPRVDLKDNARPVADLMAQITRDPIFATYAAYIQNLHARASYYAGYRWQFPLFYDPTVKPLVPDVVDLSAFENLLPLTEVFGKGSYNQVVMRSGWRKDDVFFQTRAGDFFSHHQHYDAGHFSLFHKTPLFVDAGLYTNNYLKDSRLHFSIRSVAKNTLLLPKPNEVIKPNKFFTTNVNTGGQKIINPTGSAIRSVADWQNKHQGRGAKLQRLVEVSEKNGLVEFDLTNAYPNKATQIVRSFLFMRDPQTLLIHDKIIGLKHGMVKRQFHAIHKPLLAPENQILGDSVNGIFTATVGSVIGFKNTQALLFPLLPDSNQVIVYAGPKHRFYVESFDSSGDSTFLDQSAGAKVKPWFDNPKFRIELSSDGNKDFESLVAISLAGKSTAAPKVLRNDSDILLLETSTEGVIYLKQGTKKISLRHSASKPIMLIAPADWPSIEIEYNGINREVALHKGTGILFAN